jgi:predicted nucleic acid-binding protein
MRILLDTNICIYVMNHRPARVVERFRHYKPGEIGVTAITVVELQFGVSKSADLLLENWADSLRQAFSVRSGRIWRVRSSAISLRHASILAWFPPSKISGTFRPMKSTGRV